MAIADVSINNLITWMGKHGDPFRHDVRCNVCERMRERISVAEYVLIPTALLSSLQLRAELARDGIWYWVDCACGASGEPLTG